MLRKGEERQEDGWKAEKLSCFLSLLKIGCFFRWFDLNVP